MEMIERVAVEFMRKSLEGCEAEFIRACEPSLCRCRFFARAAIEAMREPSPFMIASTLPLRVMPLDRTTILLTEKALSLLEPEDFPASGHADGAEAAQRLITDWRGMIDAALAIRATPVSEREEG